MINILLLEIISIVSLLFGILYIFLKFASLNFVFLTYLWIIFVVTVSVILHRKNRLYILILTLGWIPLVLFRDRVAASFLILTIILIYAYFQYGLNKGEYEEIVERFKTSYLFLGGFALLSIFSTKLRETLEPSIIFFIIYLLSSIILIRSIRHLSSGMDIKKLRKNNTKYILTTYFVAIIFCVEGIRNVTFRTIGNIYQWILDIFISVLYYPATLILKMFDHIVGSNHPVDEMVIDGSIEEGPMDYNFQQGEVPELLISGLSFLMSILVVLIVVYIIYRIVREMGNGVYTAVAYSEQKEYMHPRRRERKLFREKYPKEPRAQVRYYYRKYLNKLHKKNIETKEGDTSLDIQNKSKDVFKGTEKIRKIYIEARYKNQSSREKVEEIKNAYKNL